MRGHGSESVAAAIYQFGAPRSMYALHALLMQQQKQNVWQAYTANVLWTISRGLMPNTKLPSYTELIDTKRQKKEEMSGEEIVQYVLDELHKRMDEPEQQEGEE